MPFNTLIVLNANIPVYIPAGITEIPEGAVIYYDTNDNRYELKTTDGLDINDLTYCVNLRKVNVNPNSLNNLQVIVFGIIDAKRLKYLDTSTGTFINMTLNNITLHHPNIKVIK
jgi:hypothetical protein